MAIGSDTAGLLFRIRADSSQASTEVGKFTGELGTLDAQALATGGGLSSLAGPVAALAAGLAITTAVAVSLTEKLFSLAEATAEFDSKIHDAAQRAGTSAETMSALKYAADTSGSSLEKVAGSVAKFSTLLGQAENGNKKAETTLKQYGITAKETDGALAQAVKTIASMTSTTQQSAAAAALFRDRTGEILPVIKSFDGNLPALMDKLGKMGLLLSQTDADAADAFGDQMDTLKLQLGGVERTIGSAVIPALLELSTTFSNFLTSNQAEVAAWAAAIGAYTTDVVHGIESVSSAVGSAFGYINSLLSSNSGAWFNWKNAIITSVLNLLGPLGLVINALREIGSYTGGTGEQYGPFAADMNKGGYKPPPISRGGGGGGGKGGGGKAGQDPEIKDLQDRVQLQEGILSSLKKTYSDTMGDIRRELKETDDYGLFSQKAQDAQKAFIDGVVKAREELLTLSDTLAGKKGETDTELQVRLQKQWETVREYSALIRKDIENDTHAQVDAQKKLLDELAKFAEQNSKEIHDTLVRNAYDELAAAQDSYQQIAESDGATQKQREAAYNELMDVVSRNVGFLVGENNALFENAKIELDKWRAEKDAEIQKTILDEDQRKGALETVNNEYDRRLKVIKDIHDEEDKKIGGAGSVPAKEADPGFLGTLAGGLSQGAKAINSMGHVVQTFGQMAVGVFNQVGDAFGSMVANWVLYGNQGGNTFRKMAAQILASVAQQAATLAIMSLAYAALATTGVGAILLGGTPAQFLAAAAMFGAVAVTAAVAGRLVAGNAFQQQTGSATGKLSGSSVSHSNDGGSVYSSQQDQTIEQNRNAPGMVGRFRNDITLRIVSTKDHIVNVVKENVSNNGQLRTLIQDTATG